MRNLPLSTPERGHSNIGSPKGLTCWLAECNAFVVPMQRNLWADATHEVVECNAGPAGMQRNGASSSSNQAVPISADTIPYTYTYKGRDRGRWWILRLRPQIHTPSHYNLAKDHDCTLWHLNAVAFEHRQSWTSALSRHFEILIDPRASSIDRLA